MLRTALLVALLASGCAASHSTAPQPPVVEQAPEVPADTPKSDLRVSVVMPDGWTPVELSRLPQGKFTTSINEDLSASMLLSQGAAATTATAEAQQIAAELSKQGFACGPLLVDRALVSTGFTVSKGSVRGKIVVRHFGPHPLLHLVVMGNWPDDADAEGVQAVDAVIATAQLREMAQ